MTLNSKQLAQTGKQIAAYENKKETESVSLNAGGRDFVLQIDPFVASPTIMNSGVQVMNFLKEHPQLVEGKVVCDIGTGSGILGITAALIGAKKVYMTDIDEHAVENAERNVEQLNLEDVCEVFTSDLFADYGSRIKAEVQVFNHPYFPAEPIADKGWTRMMFGGTELLGRYFSEVAKYSTEDAIYISSWIKLAESEFGVSNNPSKRGSEYGFKTLEIINQNPVEMGVQKEPFEIHILKRVV